MRNTVSVKFDKLSIQLFDSEKEVWSLKWKDIERIGYRTTSGGPWNDYFLVFKKTGHPPTYYQIPLECSGVSDLASYVDSLPNTKLPREGKLANCTENKSVTIWPAEKSGEALE